VFDNLSKQPTVSELFAGVGGFRLGLERAGWRVNWSNQWEPSTKVQHASSAYVANFGDDFHSNEDIEVAITKHLRGEQEIPNSDMIVGGFPCQDYSVAKSLKSAVGLEGKKGVLWWQIHRLVAAQKPKIVFLENVDRLLKSPSQQRGRDFAVMLRTLSDLNYSIEWRVVNSAEYGFPQRRIRVFIVAIRTDLLSRSHLASLENLKGGVLNSAFPVSNYGPETIFKLGDDVEELSNGFNLGGKLSPFLTSGLCVGGKVITARVEVEPTRQATLGSVLVADDEIPSDYWIPSDRVADWEYLKGAKSIDRVSSSGHSYKYAEGKMAFPDSLDKPSRTILTGEGGTTPSRFKHVIKTDSGFRRLVPLELERLSGFPDNWTRFNSEGQEIPDAKRAFFIGNALVVGLIEMVGKELMERFFSSDAQ
jgi:DNA (cytosine-5)-methyltransferase 1